MTIHNASGYVVDAAQRASLLDVRDWQRARYAYWERLADAASEHRNEAVEAYARRKMEGYRLALWGLGFAAYSIEAADREAREAEDASTKPWRPS